MRRLEAFGGAGQLLGVGGISHAGRPIPAAPGNDKASREGGIARDLCDRGCFAAHESLVEFEIRGGENETIGDDLVAGPEL